MSTQEIISAFEALKVKEIRDIVARSIEEGEDVDAVLEACQKGMQNIGAKLELGIILAELVISAKM